VPTVDDCFEYKLVGVNVHSGTANAGHYWSYINTLRGFEEADSQDPAWAETDKDQWMEFNDSTVKDYKYENLKEECYGDKNTGGGGGMMGYGGWGGRYGKSGYMLFYERKVKKPIKIVVSEEEAKKAQEGDSKEVVTHDKETDEWIKEVPYREGLADEKPNAIFSKVHEDNSKFSFENDVYSIEFFEFIQ
jgi:ubiquitin carboxyl-terminal hydrolase 9/24